MNGLALALRIPVTRIQMIVKNDRAISADTALAAAMLVGLAAVPDGAKAASITETFVFTGTFAAGPFGTFSGRRDRVIRSARESDGYPAGRVFIDTASQLRVVFLHLRRILRQHVYR